MMSSEYIKESFQFNEESNTSMYAQLASYIKHQIRLGVFKPHDKMVTETELCEMLGISRTTVRLAMNQLLDEGLIVRYRGKGSFIAEDKIRRRLNNMYNFSESMREEGVNPSSVVLKSQIIEADEVTAKKLQLPPHQKKVFELTRIRCGDGHPLLLETTRIPYNLCEGIENIQFENTSLYNTLSNQFGLNIYHAVETIEAILIDRSAAIHLQCDKKVMPGYQIERISHLESGYIFEYTTSVTRADKCSFKLDLYNNNSNKNTMGFSRQLKH